MWIGLLFPLVWVWIVSVIDKISLYANADVCLLFRDNSNTIEKDGNKNIYRCVSSNVTSLPKFEKNFISKLSISKYSKIWNSNKHDLSKLIK